VTGSTSLINVYKKIKLVNDQCKRNDGQKDVLQSWEEVELLINKFDIRQELEKEQSRLCDKIHKLTKKFIKSDAISMARTVMRCEFDLIKKVFSGQRELERLQSLGILMEDIAKKDVGGKLNDYADFMNQILEYMLEQHVPVISKSEKITCFCISYGYCCNQIDMCDKAIEILKNAIFLMKFVHGTNASHAKYLSLCYKNVCVSYRKQGCWEDAREADRKAKAIEKSHSEENKKYQNLLGLNSATAEQLTPTRKKKRKREKQGGNSKKKRKNSETILISDVTRANAPSKF